MPMKQQISMNEDIFIMMVSFLLRISNIIQEKIDSGEKASLRDLDGLRLISLKYGKIF
jgi:hypothetical protein